ncbi:MAG: aryl-sulfate sulfotransferase [Deltaproteobacteria bacterium]|nr:aryl-sulfate sulfotransferase [Deltaproteobacteria bacterium]
MTVFSGARARLASLVCAAALLAGCVTFNSVSPNPAVPGATITLTGSGFGATKDANDAVLFDGAELTITTWSDTTIKAVLPSVNPSGTYPVAVKVDGALSSSLPLTIDAQLPISNVTITEGPNSILAAVVEFDTLASTTPTLQVSSSSGAWWVPASGILSTHPGTHHKMMVLGLKAASTYNFTIQINDNGTPRWQSFLWNTRPLQPGIQALPVTITTAQPGLMQPGYTLLCGNFGGTPTGGLYVVDAEGNLVWYLQEAAGVQISAFMRRANGNIIYLADRIKEVDPLGNVVRMWTSNSLGTGESHHEIIELPNGNFVTLGIDMREISGYPPGNVSYKVVGDEIVEFTPAGQVVSRINMFDVLDPYRIPYWPSFDFGQWDTVYGFHTQDWSHLNAVVYDPSDGNFIVSSRNQDVVFKIDRQTHELMWVIGEDQPDTTGDDDWPFLTLEGGGLLPSHQHAPQLLPDGRIVLYDNDTSRPRLPHESRPVIYSIDTNAMTVHEDWAWVDPDWDPPIFSYFSGDANWLPNGNVLVDDAGAWDAIPLGLRWIRVAEVRPSDNLKVWEMTIRQDFPTMPWTGYRAERIASLYGP